MLDPSAPRTSTAARFHREGIPSWSRPGPRGVSSLWLQGPGLPVRSWKDLPTRPPFGTPPSPQPGSAPRPSRGLLEHRDAGQAPPPPGGEACPISPPAPPSPSSFPPFSYVTLSPSMLPGPPFPPDSVSYSPRGWAWDGVSCSSPLWLAQRPADQGPRQVPATRIGLLSTEC